MPEQIQSPSMTADWEEKLLKIEHGEYDSDAFMGEISSMVSGLVKTYEAVKGADVLMQPERKVIGSCPACGRHSARQAAQAYSYAHTALKDGTAQSQVADL